jgi:hypothetical protein
MNMERGSMAVKSYFTRFDVSHSIKNHQLSTLAFKKMEDQPTNYITIPYRSIPCHIALCHHVHHYARVNYLKSYDVQCECILNVTYVQGT